MRRLETRAFALMAGLAVFTAGSVMAATPAPASNAPAHVEVSNDGPILVTPAGMTLYTNQAEDPTPGKSMCSNVPKTTYEDQQGGLGFVPVIGADIHKACTQKWPPFMAAANAQAAGDFTLIDRTDGGKQWAFQGHALYQSIRDKQPGDHNGIGAGLFGGRGGMRLARGGDQWPAGMKFIRLDDALVLATPNGRPVYTPKGHRGSTDEDVFKPILAPATVSLTGDWSTADAGAGRLQYAFKGKPLYAAPDGVSEYDIDELGGWEPVVFRKTPPPPSDIKKQMALIGEVYTTKDGHTLYTYNCSSPSRDAVRCDEPGDPAGYLTALCGDAAECARRWHPYIASANAKPSGEFSVVDVTYPMYKENPGALYPADLPHVKVWAYRGTPLWTYYEDKAPGDIWGTNIKWIGGSSFGALQVPGREIQEN